MWFEGMLQRYWGKTSGRSLRHQRNPRRPRTSLVLERLEDRTVPAITSVTSTGLTLNEGATAVISNTQLSATSDLTNPVITFTLTQAPADGSLILTPANQPPQTLAVGGTFTLDDITNGRLSYSQVQNPDPGTESPSDSFGFTVSDGSPTTGTGTFKVTITDLSVKATSGLTFTAVEGQSQAAAQTVATFTDPGGADALTNYSADIAWGDGQTNKNATITFDATSGVFTVSGSHTYGEEGSPNIIVTIHHGTAADAVVTSQASVSDPAVVATAGSVKALEGVSGSVTVATFTDPGGAEPNASDPGAVSNHYSATIDWGDGPAGKPDVTPGTISGPDANGVFTVTGMHSFAAEGTFTATVTINHENAPPTTVQVTVTVADNIGVLLLDPTGKGALTAGGNGSVLVKGSGAITVDSTSASAVTASGHGKISAGELDISGTPGTRTNGKAAISGEISSGEKPTADPFAGLAAPTPPTQTFAAVHYSGKAPLMLSPGLYQGGIDISGSGPVTLEPGIYFLQGGGFRVSGHANVTGKGVMIYLAPGGGGVSITGQSRVNLTASTTLTGANAVYNGITIFEDQTSSASVKVAGQGSLTMTGILYAAQATLDISGKGRVAVLASSVNAEFIGADLRVTGNGSFSLDPTQNTPGPGTATAPTTGGGSSTTTTGGSGTSTSKGHGNGKGHGHDNAGSVFGAAVDQLLKKQHG
jgi:hypothetical protein